MLQSYKNIYLFVLALAFVGLFFIFEASSVRGFNEYSDSFHFFKLQAMWITAGFFLMFFFSRLNYHRLYYLAFPLMLVTIVTLLLVLLPGIGSSAGGARRWIDLGIINFQPTELAKFSIIIYLSSWFLNRERKRFASFVGLLSILMFLIILQPDLGTAIIIFSISVAIYFIAGVQIHYLFLFIPFALAAFYFLINISPYRFRRLTAFLDPSTDPLGIGYHINQILISLSNGGLFGLGFGISKQKYLYLPEAHTDSIFAIISEEFGFVGGFLLILALMALLYKIYVVAYSATDRLGKYLAGGILAYFGLQIIINLGGIVSLLPLTGVPLPFISYGGSNLLVSFSLIGILINIAKRTKRV
ncbi:MAG: putative peptidoglycan glycosyltransferase FtsW [Patescibacteria group bacterium]